MPDPDTDDITDRSVLDHSNGLILCRDNRCHLYVCNLATWRWEKLSNHADDMFLLKSSAYLAFNSSLLHYEVFVIPERAFVQDGKPAGKVEEMRLDPSEHKWSGSQQQYAIYYQGALYAYCRGGFVASFGYVIPGTTPRSTPG
uniref:Uncharacterized protein n=1 Tax=Oryza punctata TaxID=4537 RepID=A0A0E0MHG3_ORYPU